MDYADVAKTRMQSKSNNNPIDLLIQAGSGNINIKNYYTEEQDEAILVEDDSDENTDEKILYTKYEFLSEGDVITWKNTNWILFQEELTTGKKYSKFFIIESLSKIRFYIDGIKSKEHPISFLDVKSGLNTPKTSSRYIYQDDDSEIKAIINKNPETDELSIGSEIIINGTVWEVNIKNTYENNSVIILGLSKVKKSNTDDLDNNIANTDDSIGGNTIYDGTYEYIISGDPTISINSSKKYKVYKIDNKGNREAITSATFSITTSLVVMGQNNGVATVTAQSETGSFLLRATADGKSLSTTIKITNFWG